MSIENEFKKITAAVVANTAALEVNTAALEVNTAALEVIGFPSQPAEENAIAARELAPAALTNPVLGTVIPVVPQQVPEPGVGAPLQTPVQLQQPAIPTQVVQPIPPVPTVPAHLTTPQEPPVALVQQVAISDEEINVLLVAESQRIGADGTPQILGIMGSLGGDKVSMIPQENRLALINQIQALPAGQ